jgi:hypothetical protein
MARRRSVWKGRLCGLVWSALLLCVTASAAGEVVTVSAWDFSPQFSGVTWDATVDFYRYATTSPNNPPGSRFFAGVDLPAGAAVTRLEVEACDESTLGGWSLTLHSNPIVSGPNDSIASLQSFFGGFFEDTPGCGLFARELSPPVVLDPTGQTIYHLRFLALESNSDVRFRAVSVHYEGGRGRRP